MFEMTSQFRIKSETRFVRLELADIASNRAKEFANLLTSEILQKFQAQFQAPNGIFTCLKSLAAEIPIPELQLILHIGETQPVKKTLVVRMFTTSMGYSTVYRKLNKLVEGGIVVDKDGSLTLAEKYGALAILAQLQRI